ncbi:TfoX/Sxy family protein [Lampropedia puyangensis]|uniref:TfoX/Sxy family protein n=1 Tax=Lampropedia puyangensis TaxID=1330072 RepID=A0A4S8EYI9_9BURK|nr:TfoX/Sxy family protein [Lampropedia puyangensis]THT99658.1 TfoX/Sxy family protein [Lampropedia puyangensis]
MPARPLAPETLHLIDAVRDALIDYTDVEEKSMFGCYVFMVNGKLCLGVENDELLVRLPPSTHAEVAETAGVRPLSSKGGMDGYFFISPVAYATRTAWQHWIGSALAFNPLAKASPKRKKNMAAKPVDDTPTPQRQSATAQKGIE